MLVNHDQYEQNGSKVVSIVYHLLQMIVDDFGKLPKKLHINLDNCWRFVIPCVIFLILDYN